MCAQIVTPQHALTTAGFTKLPLIAENKNKEKVRLYHLDPLRDKVEAARIALKKKMDNEGYTYNKEWKTFKNDIQKTPYLLKEGKTFCLLSSKEAIELQIQYGVIGPKAKEETNSVFKLLDNNEIKTDKKFVIFYNQATPDIQNALLPLINAMFVTFSRERIVLTAGEVKTLVLLGQCNHEGVQSGALSLLSDLFEKADFISPEYGFGLKYLIDKMPIEFLKKNQLLLLIIFDKLSKKLNNLLHTGKSVNHEIDPLMASLISVARALLSSGLEKLNKETKDEFYKRIKEFYSDEKYSKKIEALPKHTNYFLVHSSLWITQHLIHITSSEHKVMTGLRKTFYGVVTIKDILAIPAGTAIKLYHGDIPGTELIEDLKQAYEHGKKAFGFKDIPRPWFELLEETEAALLDPCLSKVNLRKIYELVPLYETEKKTINTILETIKLENVALEAKEFVFGFVRQLTDIAMDHQQKDVRLEALAILGEIFEVKGQSEDVRLLILTTLQNIIDKKNDPILKEAQSSQTKLHKRKPELVDRQLLRQSKYPCLALLPEDDQLLKAARSKLEVVSEGKQPLPMSKFVYGTRDIKIFKQTVKIGGNFAPKGPEPLSADELKRAVAAAKEMHIIANARRPVDFVTELGNKKETTFEAPVVIEGDFTG